MEVYDMLVHCDIIAAAVWRYIALLFWLHGYVIVCMSCVSFSWSQKISLDIIFMVMALCSLYVISLIIVYDPPDNFSLDWIFNYGNVSTSFSCLISGQLILHTQFTSWQSCTNLKWLRRRDFIFLLFYTSIHVLYNKAYLIISFFVAMRF